MAVFPGQTKVAVILRWPQQRSGRKAGLQYIYYSSVALNKIHMASLSFRGGKVALEESRGTKSERLFHTFCHYNQI